MMKNRIAVKQQGFTLLELLLVLSLIVALTVAGIAVYQIQTRNFKVDKTALQMQQWLQATMSFYTDCGQWPDPSPNIQSNIVQAMTGAVAITPKACPTLTANAFRAYMPLNADISGPWNGNNYAIVSGSAVNKLNIITVQTVIVGAPGTSLGYMQTIGNLIAARLPYATAQAAVNQEGLSQVTVSASVNTPGTNGGGGNNGQGFLLGMQMVNRASLSQLQNPLTKALCPPGMKGVMGYAMSKLKSAEDGGRAAVIQASSNYDPKNQTSAYIKLDMDVINTKNNPNTKENEDNQMLLITACIPATTSAATKNSPKKSDNANRF